MNFFDSISSELYNELIKIEPSKDSFTEYYPCKVILKNDSEVDRVFIIEQNSYINKWGVYPENDKGKYEIKIEEVKNIMESPSRIPVKYANELYKSGESGMGYTIFTIVFSDGLQIPIVTGNAIDFIDYPEGKGPKDIVKVLPHEGRNKNPKEAPKYYWCIFSSVEKISIQKWLKNKFGITRNSKRPRL